LDTQNTQKRAEDVLRRLGRDCSTSLAKRIDKEVQQLAALGGGKFSAKKVRRDVRFKANRVCSHDGIL
jgi:hypothetical protein